MQPQKPTLLTATKAAASSCLFFGATPHHLVGPETRPAAKEKRLNFPKMGRSIDFPKIMILRFYEHLFVCVFFVSVASRLVSFPIHFRLCLCFGSMSVFLFPFPSTFASTVGSVSFLLRFRCILCFPDNTNMGSSHSLEQL